jgi:hypothetical protein
LYSPIKIQLQEIRFRVAGKVCLEISTVLNAETGKNDVSYCFEEVRRRSTLGFRRFALGNDGIVQFCTEGVRKFVYLVFAVDLNGLLGCIADDVAVVAPSKMLLKLSLQVVVQRTLEKIIQLG